MNRLYIIGIGIIIITGAVSHLNLAYPQTAEQTDMMLDYCVQHADRAAAGENVTNDLVVAGLLDLQYGNMTCNDVKNLHDYYVGLQMITDAYRKYHHGK